jgi:hypothetical protein
MIDEPERIWKESVESQLRCQPGGKILIIEIIVTIITVGFEVLTAVLMKSTIFWDITPCSPLKDNRHFEGTCRLYLQRALCLPHAFTLVSCLACSSTLKMKATRSSQTSVDFQRTTRRYIPEDSTLQL